MAPSIGRIVHYQAHGSPDGSHKSVPRAAMITQVHNDTCVDLCVINPSGFFFNTSVVLDESESPRGGTWRWPPRAQSKTVDAEPHERCGYCNVAPELPTHPDCKVCGGVKAESSPRT